MASTLDRVLGLLRSAAEVFLGTSKRTPTRQRPRSGSSTAPGRRPAPPASTKTGTRPGASAPRPAPGAPATGLSSPYPGDFQGTGTVRYAPAPDGNPDPGEVVWTWVPYEEDYTRGKDRPVLLVGAAKGRLLGLMLTSKDHSNDHRGDNDYVDLGTGPWDKQGRESEVKLDRILQIDPRDIRREGSVLDARRFDTVATGLRSRHGWR
ncbi:type II toxin-antitoxin system PemK/MazF family toxin [Arthrobacter sp. 35W]|uniref:type II toxin-antitoxin system PemK/MazF family toxin n=1 Tax=Arthrobacter sp. 35W TaxID=1132441 RepID=UPI00040C41C4|nr:type II toxin-antitoxin system PemK/MazF family toxin [Arthrobacter sp. 35W]